ncbi:acetyltransferase domain protein [Rhodococcus sp. MTM3W5.2]|uniref:GNAT family N-acetyltransferase n=1 Tax=Rhodococcus sp. MTM3W5.2 TaxID=1805827 RepID=UPI0009796275|nr:GNAT family N-acetyltransferase [Rhodococcus sp. MTM3W5.2]AQA21939.1 acetyltransferase domain protein [Rhodococcus sp. MTM3W5.2]
MLELRRTDGSDPEFRALAAALDGDLHSRYGNDQDAYTGFNELAADAVVVVAYEEGIAVGCGAFRPHDEHRVELKRMYVADTHRGRGIARAVLGALEEWARRAGFAGAVLETGVLQTEAMALYRRSGYEEVENFGPYIGMPLSVCFAKVL